jgi:opacity protein-like surface antigen
MNYIIDNKVSVMIEDTYSESTSLEGMKRMNYSLTFGAGVEFNLTRSISFMLQPDLKYSITPINENNPVLSYPYTFGLMGGLRIQF